MNGFYAHPGEHQKTAKKKKTRRVHFCVKVLLYAVELLRGKSRLYLDEELPKRGSA